MDDSRGHGNSGLDSNGASNTASTSAKRPRDHRLVHLVLASQGVTAHQERVPLQLLDFAYRYTAGVLSDALALSAEGYGGASAATSSRSGRGSGAANAAAAAAASGEDGNITLPAMKLAIASRMQYQFNAALPKEFQMDLAQERNKIALPRVEREFGLRLPPERYCFVGSGWSIKEEWDSEGEEEVEEVTAEGDGEGTGAQHGGTDEVMGEGGEDFDQEEFEEAMGVKDGGGDSEMTGA